MHKKPFFGLLLVATLAIATMPASAGVLLYTTQSSWQTAIAGLTTSTVDLSNAPGVFATTFTSDGITFSGNPFVIGSTGLPFSTGPYIFGNGLITSSILTSNVYAIGLMVGCSGGCGILRNQVSASTASGTTVLYDNPSFFWQGSFQFWGFVSDTPLTNVVFTSFSTQPGIALQGITLGSSSSGGGGDPPGDTPEMATLLLIGTGLGVIARYRRYACLPTTA